MDAAELVVLVFGTGGLGAICGGYIQHRLATSARERETRAQRRRDKGDRLEVVYTDMIRAAIDFRAIHRNRPIETSEWKDHADRFRLVRARVLIVGDSAVRKAFDQYLALVNETAEEESATRIASDWKHVDAATEALAEAAREHLEETETGTVTSG